MPYLHNIRLQGLESNKGYNMEHMYVTLHLLVAIKGRGKCCFFIGEHAYTLGPTTPKNNTR
jgi:hypothetical protein